MSILSNIDVQFIKGVGEFRSKLLHNLDIYTVEDLIEFFPRDYQPRNINAKIRDIKEGQYISMTITVFSVDEVTTKGGTKLLKAVITDGERFMECVWFTYGKWITNLVKRGKTLRVSGQVSEYNGNKCLSHPQMEEATEVEDKDNFWATRPVLPIYSLTANLTQINIRNIVHQAFLQHHKDIHETLPAFLIEKYHFLDRKTALQKMHFTTHPQDIPKIKARFIYEEFLHYQIVIVKNKQAKADIIKEKKYTYKDTLIKQLTANLPFALTSDQKKVVNEIVIDLKKDKPMNRLLQGDVGAGKTVVTLFAMLLAIENGYQTALIAPTEILAEQHYKTITNLLKGFEGIRICLILGGVTKQKRLDKQAIADGEIAIAIGTHALIQKDIVFKNLSLVIIDEQHRFGVAQRSELSLRHNYPDLLYLSATPIPRSLAMTVFGDITISSIKELPPTRKPIKTILVPGNKKNKVYDEIERELKAGRQAYIVCPLIEASEKSDLQDAETLYERVSRDIFPEYQTAILHGRMKQAEKEQIMSAFKAGETQILISTTVIEVGIDVPNASVMMVEHAERFGLAQLHQLRGRVGRGAEQSFCYLIAYHPGDIGRERLNTLVRTTDGFEIAEKDMQLRGPGEIFGTNQSGLPAFRHANLMTDQDWLNTARADAELIIEEDPDLLQEKHKSLRENYKDFGVKRDNYSKF